jgi:hypothetical protein
VVYQKDDYKLLIIIIPNVDLKQMFRWNSVKRD